MRRPANAWTHGHRHRSPVSTVRNSTGLWCSKSERLCRTERRDFLLRREGLYRQLALRE